MIDIQPEFFCPDLFGIVLADCSGGDHGHIGFYVVSVVPDGDFCAFFFEFFCVFACLNVRT